MTKRMETTLAIRAVDKYSRPLREMQRTTGRFADGVRRDMGALQKLRGPLALIADFRKQTEAARSSAAALDRARDKVRRLQAALVSTKQPSKAMRAEFNAARASAERLSDSHRRNQTRLLALRRQMQGAGLDVADLAAHERRLTEEIAAGDRALEARMARMRALSERQARLTEGREVMDRHLARAGNLTLAGHAAMTSGRGILRALQAPTERAVRFEAAMADVRKVVEFDSPEGLARLSEEILEMSTRIPVAAEGLAQIVAAGGQSGLQAQELTRFAEMAAKVGVAFDISADQAGTSMAEIKTALRLDLGQTGRLFDAMNHLSNNMSSTAPKVLDFMNRAANFGETYGFDPEQTLAVGSAMIAAGTQADVAATSFKNVGRALTAGASASKTQKAALKVLGLEANDLAQSMQRDAEGTLMMVLERLGQVPKAARAATISALFGNEAGAVMPLINDLDQLRKSLGLIADEQAYLGSAEAEFAARAATTEAAMQKLGGSFAQLSVVLGNELLPPLNAFLAWSQRALDRLTAWARANPGFARGLAFAGAALGGLAVAGGALLTVSAGFMAGMAVLRFGLLGLGLRAGGAAKGILWLVRRFGALRRLKVLKLASLIAPLKWTEKLLPSFALALARFTGFRKDASAEMTGLADHAQRKTAAIQQNLSRLRWSTFGAAIMMGGAMASYPEGAANIAAFQENNRRRMDEGLRKVPGLGWLMRKYDQTFEAIHGRPPPAVAGARARGGPVAAGQPYLVNEDTPQSEIFVPSRSGAVLNVAQGQAALRAHLAGGIGPRLGMLRQGGAAVARATLMALPMAQIAGPMAADAGPGGAMPEVQVTLHGGITVNLQGTPGSGVRGPQLAADLADQLAEQVADRIGQRLRASVQASFADR